MAVREIKLSPKVTGKVGFPDGHIEVAVTLPWPLGTHTLRIEAGEIDAAEQFITEGRRIRDALFGSARRAQRR